MDVVTSFTALMSGRFGITDSTSRKTGQCQLVYNCGAMMTVYPNPATDRAIVSFNLPASAAARLYITDALGKTMYHTNTFWKRAGMICKLIPKSFLLVCII